MHTTTTPLLTTLAALLLPLLTPAAPLAPRACAEPVEWSVSNFYAAPLDGVVDFHMTGGAEHWSGIQCLTQPGQPGNDGVIDASYWYPCNNSGATSFQFTGAALNIHGPEFYCFEMADGSYAFPTPVVADFEIYGELE
ncbi:hypothetical protein MMC17_001354 [Xylographa soralifera]|nr:hypothetical protein [Xylographa soralifera]